MAMTQTSRQKLGQWGEEAAANYLIVHGYHIIESNHRTPYGEIDLVASLEELTIFIEVKTRASKTLGLPEISITPRKQIHMRQSAEYYIQQHPQLSGSWRIDVVSVQQHAAGQPPTITHFQNAIT
jgi:putative endonuclease